MSPRARVLGRSEAALDPGGAAAGGATRVAPGALAPALLAGR
jgi:hypothetical protein